MANKPSKHNKLYLSIRSKVQIPERVALEAVLKLLQTGRKSGLLPEYGLFVQRISTATGEVVYIREMSPGQRQYCLSQKMS